jgi:hypothetical protein
MGWKWERLRRQIYAPPSWDGNREQKWRVCLEAVFIEVRVADSARTEREIPREFRCHSYAAGEIVHLACPYPWLTLKSWPVGGRRPEARANSRLSSKQNAHCTRCTKARPPRQQHSA